MVLVTGDGVLPVVLLSWLSDLLLLGSRLCERHTHWRVGRPSAVISLIFVRDTPRDSHHSHSCHSCQRHSSGFSSQSLLSQLSETLLGILIAVTPVTVVRDTHTACATDDIDDSSGQARKATTSPPATDWCLAATGPDKSESRLQLPHAFLLLAAQHLRTAERTTGGGSQIRWQRVATLSLCLACRICKPTGHRYRWHASRQAGQQPCKCRTLGCPTPTARLWLFRHNNTVLRLCAADAAPDEEVGLSLRALAGHEADGSGAHSRLLTLTVHGGRDGGSAAQPAPPKVSHTRS